MLTILAILISLGASIFGFRWAHRFFGRRLRYVDAAQNRFAPVLAGAIGAALFLPVTWLPLIGVVLTGGTALAFGIGVGLGAAAASREIRLATYRVDRWS